MKINKLRLKDKSLYLVVEFEQYNNETELLDAIAVDLENNIQIIQLNCGHANTKNIIKTGKKIRELCSIYDALLMVNDRIDVALEIDADGVFLDENSFTVDSARVLLSDKHIIGTNYLTKNIDFIITENEIVDTQITCYTKDLVKNKDNKKIIYKKI